MLRIFPFSAYILSSWGWGADFVTLRSLYISLICPKLLYGSLIFQIAARTTLSTISYSICSCYIPIGVLRCTPFILLQSAAHRRCLSLYNCNVLFVPCNHFRDVIQSYYLFGMCSNQRLHLPVSGRIFHELQQRCLMFRDILSLPLHTRYCILLLQLIVLYIALTRIPLLLYIDVFRTLPSFLNIQTTRRPPLTVPFKILSAVSFLLQAKLPTGTSICTAKLYAIFRAAIYISTLPRHFLILTDSLSSITALSSHHSSSHYVFPKISSLLSGLPPNKVIVQCVPNHIEISSNELADNMTDGSLPPSLTPLRFLFLLTTFVVVLTHTIIHYSRLIGTVFFHISVLSRLFVTS